jgi:hypothetical protein
MPATPPRRVDGWTVAALDPTLEGVDKKTGELPAQIGRFPVPQSPVDSSPRSRPGPADHHKARPRTHLREPRWLARRMRWTAAGPDGVPPTVLAGDARPRGVQRLRGADPSGPTRRNRQ